MKLRKFISKLVAIFAVPALPGIQKILPICRESFYFLHNTSSRPPLPIKAIFIIKELLYIILIMSEIKAKLKYLANTFEVIERGDYVECAVSKKKISLENLNYWNVDLQEAYFSPAEVKIRFEKLK